MEAQLSHQRFGVVSSLQLFRGGGRLEHIGKVFPWRPISSLDLGTDILFCLLMCCVVASLDGASISRFYTSIESLECFSFATDFYPASCCAALRGGKPECNTCKGIFYIQVSHSNL